MNTLGIALISFGVGLIISLKLMKEAENETQAQKLFRAIYQPFDSYDALLKYCSMYDERSFKNTIMYKSNDNLGAGCHCKISIKKETV